MEFSLTELMFSCNFLSYNFLSWNFLFMEFSSHEKCIHGTFIHEIFHHGIFFHEIFHSCNFLSWNFLSCNFPSCNFLVVTEETSHHRASATDCRSPGERPGRVTWWTVASSTTDRAMGGRGNWLERIRGTTTKGIRGTANNSDQHITGRYWPTKWRDSQRRRNSKDLRRA